MLYDQEPARAEVHKSRALNRRSTKFCMVLPKLLVPQGESCFMSSSWCLEFELALRFLENVCTHTHTHTHTHIHTHTHTYTHMEGVNLISTQCSSNTYLYQTFHDFRHSFKANDGTGFRNYSWPIPLSSLYSQHL